jgi:threonine/homoserine/homoserine lactone efflux protein
MSSLSVFLSIAAALSIGAMSPGPSFVMVSRIAVSRSRIDGLAAALGMGLGGVVFSILALAGLTALLSQFEWLYLALKVAGGIYLIYIAFRIWRGASDPLDMGRPHWARAPSAAAS